MGKPEAIDARAKARKAAANREAYLAERKGKDRVLLRLDRGMAARLDAARADGGLSRSAFASLHLGLAIEAIVNSKATAAPGIGEEFDQLFASGSS